MGLLLELQCTWFMFFITGYLCTLWMDIGRSYGPIKLVLVGQITVRKYKLLVTFTGWIPKTFPGVISMLSQLHDVYQTNPAFIKRICLGILCFNTVNQLQIITQSSCREEMEKWIQKKCQGSGLQSILCLHI